MSRSAIERHDQVRCFAMLPSLYGAASGPNSAPELPACSITPFARDDGRKQPRRSGVALLRLHRLLAPKPHYVFHPQQLLRRLTYGSRRRKLGHGELLPIRLPWCLELGVDPTEAIGSSIARTGVYDLIVSETLYRLTDPGDAAVDAGANIGYTTSILAHRSGPEGSVTAFEPHPELFERLNRNINRWPRDRVAPVTAHRLALSKSRGDALLQVGPEFQSNMGTAALETPNSGPSTGGGHLVELIRLDEIADKLPIGVLKIDVEGHEHAVLEGMSEILARRQARDIIFEERVPYPTATTELLKAAGFRIFELRQSLWGPRLLGLGENGARRLRSWDPPSYLATLEPERAAFRLQPRRWSVFRAERPAPTSPQ